MTSYLSLTVLGLFLPISIAAYQIAPRRARWVVLLAASALFFWSVSGKLIAFLGVSVLTVWAFGLLLGNLAHKHVQKSHQLLMRASLAAGIAINVVLLFYFKYLAFAHQLLAPLAEPLLAHVGIELPERVSAIAAPIGISFYSLQAVAYLVDVYRRQVEPTRNPARLALFLSFFPQVMEGPICRWNQTAEALMAGRPVTAKGLAQGGYRILWGLFKKLIVADRVNLLVKSVFADHASYDGGVLLLAGTLYTLQLYCDFSGTMDFVVGTGRIFGIEMPENFRQPFFSRLASEFWLRWHITLGTWFRDYVFYPISLSGPVKRLGKHARKALGARMGPVAVSGIALLAVWLCNGLWHGAGARYVIFGLYWFAIIWLGGFLEPIAQCVCPRLHIDRASTPWHVIQHVRTLAIVVCGEIIFRAPGARAGIDILWRIATDLTPTGLLNGTLAEAGLEPADAACVALAVIVLFVVGFLRERGISISARLAHASYAQTCVVCLLSLLVLVIFGAYGAGYVPVDPMYASF